MRKHIFQTDTSHCIFITQACTINTIMRYHITHEVVVFDNLYSNQPLFCLQLISPIFFQYLFTSTFSQWVQTIDFNIGISFCSMNSFLYPNCLPSNELFKTSRFSFNCSSEVIDTNVVGMHFWLKAHSSARTATTIF